MVCKRLLPIVRCVFCFFACRCWWVCFGCFAGVSLVSYSSDRLEICANVRLFDCCHGGRVLCVYYFIFCFLFCLFFLIF